MHLKRNGVIKMTTMNDDLFDIAMSLACDSDLESELALFRSFDEIPCSFSEEHCRNIRYILSHNGRRPIWKRKMVFAHFTARRMAASIAVVFSLVLCGCACFPNVRAAVRELAVEFYDQYVGITDDSNAVLKEPMVHHFPTYIPEGYEIEKEDLTIAGGRIIYTMMEREKFNIFNFIINMLLCTLILRVPCCRMSLSMSTAVNIWNIPMSGKRRILSCGPTAPILITL